MRVLGLSAYFHDAAAALVIDGRLIAAAQEERYSRIKHDASFPQAAAEACLRLGGLTAADLDAVVFYEKPLRKLERILVSGLREFPRSLGPFVRAMRVWLGGRLWLKDEIALRLGCDRRRVLFCEHHLSHAAAAFLTSPFADAAIVTVDGVGEWTSTAIHHGTSDAGGSRIASLAEQHYPHSLGLLYSALTAYLGFEVNEGEYKVMGLSAYGEPRYLDELRRLCRIGADGTLELDPRYFAYRHDASRSFTPLLEELLGPARRPHAPLDLAGPRAGWSPDARRWADVAASLQRHTEDAMLAVCAEAARRTGSRNLCLAGGVALNSVANRRIAEEGPFAALHVHPAAGDAGGAVGAALYVSCVAGGDRRRADSRCGDGPARLGEAWSTAAVSAFLRDCRVEHRALGACAGAPEEALVEAVADLLVDGQVGGWVQGRAEWGPRALGGRSILADPRRPEIQDRVNAQVKLRERFRPFAPVVLAEDAERFFDLGRGADRHLWPVMCSVLPVLPAARAVIPAVVHVDGTARVQIVGADGDPRLRALLLAFRRRTGVGVLLNTSLNLRDEPICNSPAEALGTFLRSDLDFLVLEDVLVPRRALAASAPSALDPSAGESAAPGGAQGAAA